MPSSGRPEGVLQLVERGSRLDPHRVGVRAFGGAQSLSYGDLLDLSARVGERLRGAGVKAGSPVGLLAPNGIEFVLGLLGIRSIDAVAAPLDPNLAPDEIDSRLQTIGAVGVVTPVNAANVVGAPVLGLDVRAAGGGVDPTVTGVAREAAATPSLPKGCELLMFTAGTTGTPKAVPWTAAAMAASLDGIIGSLELTPEDATLLVMPLFHGHGLMAGLLATLATGGCATLPETGRFSASRFWAEILDAKASWYTGVPTMHQILLARADDEYPGADRAPLRFIRTCSAPMAGDVAASIERTFRAPIVSAYGMTETSHQATSVPVRDAGPGTTGTVGLPTSVEVRIDDGQVLVRGPALTPGYVNDDEANRSSFVDSWFATGDQGRLDDRGYLSITGRIKELINRGGEKIAPSAVEAALLSDPDVTDAAAFGVPDPTYGERVEAAVSVKESASLTGDQLRNYASDRLSKAEIPDRILVLDRLPHTAKGTPDRRALVALATGEIRERR